MEGSRFKLRVDAVRDGRGLYVKLREDLILRYLRVRHQSEGLEGHLEG